jgi:hypothetical protein
MQSQLQVYYDSNCTTALFTQELISSVRNLRPRLSIEVVDLNKLNVQVPNTIVAVPAYVLNGDTIFMGNPTHQALIERLNSC